MNNRKMFLILINCIIAINTIIIATMGIVFGAGDGQLGTYIIGLGYFKPYTMDSNILTGVVAILVIVVILGVTFTISYLLTRIHNFYHKRR